MTDHTPDTVRADHLVALVENLLKDGIEGTAGVQCILREIEALEPGAIENMAARLQLRRLERMGRKPN